MIFKQVLMIIICIFFFLGMLDYFFGGRFGIGAEFKRAFSFSGTIILTAVGMVSLSPVLAAMLQPVIVPLYAALGADAAMFAPTFLAPDSGGYAIATQMAADAQVGAWAGTVVAAHLGSTFCFNIPISLNIIEKEYHRSFSLGALSGIIACPFGCILGGILAHLPLLIILKNMVPALIVSLFIVLGLSLAPEIFIRGFVGVGRFITLVILFGLTLAVIERLTGIALLPGMNPISAGLTVAGTVVVTIAGILCLTYLLIRCLKRQLNNLSRILGINEFSFLGIIMGFTAIIPGLITFKDMDNRGRVLFSAAITSSANILGAHLGYIGTTAPEMLMPTMAGKLLSGLIAIVVALLLCRRLLPRGQQSKVPCPVTIPPA